MDYKLNPEVEAYIQKKKDPEYWRSLRQDASDAATESAEGNLAAALSKSAAQIGTIGGKTADASPVAELARGLEAGTDKFLGRLGQGRNERDEDEQFRIKLYQDLEAKAAAADESKQRRAEDQAFKSDQAEKDRQARAEMGARDRANKLEIAEMMGKEKQEAREAAATREKAPGSPQYLAAGFGKRLETASQIMDQLEAKGYQPQSLGTGLRRGMPEILGGNYLRNADDQVQEQAERNFVNAVLRRESGSAIAPSEFESAAKQYFPRAGDSPAVLANKKAARLQAVDNLKAEASGAWDKVPSAMMATPKKTELPGIIPTATAADQNAAKTVVKTEISPSTGKKRITYSDGTQEIQ